MDIDTAEPSKSWTIAEAAKSPSALDVLAQPLNVTVTFNIARLLEDMGQIESAIKLHLAILREHPAYSDCYARLAYIAKARKMYHEAEKWFKDIEASRGESAKDEVQIALGSLYLHQGDKKSLEKAQACFTTVMSKDKKNIYASLHLANIYLSAARESEDPERREKFLTHAMDFLYAALRHDPHNIFAANGLAIVFYERGLVSEAKDFFMQVREATGSIPDVFINLAHMNVIEGQFEKAIKLYKTALNQFYGGKNTEIFNYIAKCYFELGQFVECKAALRSLLELNPNDRDAQFNLALAMKENATRLYSDPAVTSEKLNVAIDDYKNAVPIFRKLIELSTEKVRRAYSASKCQKFATMCENNMELAMERIHSVRENELAKAEELKKKKDLMEEAAREKQRKLEEEAKAEALRKLENERVAKEGQARLEEIKQKLVKRQEEEQLLAQQQAERRKRESSTPIVREKKAGKKKKRKGKQEEEESAGHADSEEGADYDPNKSSSKEEEVEYEGKKEGEAEEREAKEEDFASEESDGGEFRVKGHKKGKGKKGEGDADAAPRRSGREQKRKRANYKDDDSNEEGEGEAEGESKKKKRRIVRKSDKPGGGEEDEGGELLDEADLMDEEKPTLTPTLTTAPASQPEEKGLLEGSDEALFDD